jgi:hypothetical protein
MSTEINKFYRDEFFKFIIENRDVNEKDVHAEEDKAIKEYYNIEPKGNLLYFLEFINKFSFEAGIGEFEIWDADYFPVPKQSDGNTLEQSIEEPVYLLAALCNALALGSSSCGDIYFVDLDESSSYEVIISHHDESFKPIVLCDSIASFALLNYAAELIRGDKADKKQIRSYLETLSQKVNLSRDMTDIAEFTGMSPQYGSESPIIKRFKRAEWLFVLFYHGKLFIKPVKDELMKAYNAFIEQAFLNASDFVYLLLSMFFIKEKEKLEKLMNLAKDHPASLVRDTASIITELLNGRNTLGEIDDIKSVQNDICTD